MTSFQVGFYAAGLGSGGSELGCPVAENHNIHCIPSDDPWNFSIIGLFQPIYCTSLHIMFTTSMYINIYIIYNIHLSFIQYNFHNFNAYPPGNDRISPTSRHF